MTITGSVNDGTGSLDTFGGNGFELTVGQTISSTLDGRMAILGSSTSSFPEYGLVNEGLFDMISIMKAFAPVITLPEKIITRYQGDELDLLNGVVVNDVEDGLINPSKITITGAPEDTSELGEYKITYSVTDGDGNVGVAEAVLLIHIPIPPTLTIPETARIQPGESFDPMVGVNAIDPDGGVSGEPIDITENVTVSGVPVDMDVSGSYIIVYKVEDAQGNVVVEERTLIIEEKPIINFPERTVLDVGSIFNPIDGVTASDAEDGLISNIWVVGDTVDTSVPGKYYVEYRVVDSKGNVTTAIRIVHVSERPVITHPGNTVVIIGDEFFPLKDVNADDAEDGDLTNAIQVSGSVNVNISGRYEITYSVADSAGATTTENRVIIVTSQPTISGADTV